MKPRIFLYLLPVILLLVGSVIVVRMQESAEKETLDPNRLETLLIPSDPNERDIRFKLTIPSVFLHQRGENWDKKLSDVSFALDTRTNSATTLSPIEQPAVVVVILAISAFDTLEARFNADHPRSTGGMDWIWSHKIERRQGLNYVTNQVYPGAPLTEYMFDDGPHYRKSIECRPSGNSYPSLCTLTEIGVRGGGVKSNANDALSTDIVFRNERLAEWKSISDHVQAFLKDKITMIEGGRREPAAQ
jgi:hypothetical protein